MRTIGLEIQCGAKACRFRRQFCTYLDHIYLDADRLVYICRLFPASLGTHHTSLRCDINGLPLRCVQCLSSEYVGLDA